MNIILKLLHYLGDITLSHQMRKQTAETIKKIMGARYTVWDESKCIQSFLAFWFNLLETVFALKMDVSFELSVKCNHKNFFIKSSVKCSVVNLRSCWTGFLLVGFFACLVFCGYSMVSTGLVLGLGWVSPC